MAKKNKIPVAGMTLNMLAEGYAGRAIDAGLARVMEDIQSRGHDRKKRTLTIKLDFTPDQTGQCMIEVDVGCKMPSFRPPATIAKHDVAAGGLVFSPDCADNPDQAALPNAGNGDDD